MTLNLGWQLTCPLRTFTWLASHGLCPLLGNMGTGLKGLSSNNTTWCYETLVSECSMSYINANICLVSLVSTHVGSAPTVDKGSPSTTVFSLWKKVAQSQRWPTGHGSFQGHTRTDPRNIHTHVLQFCKPLLTVASYSLLVIFRFSPEASWAFIKLSEQQFDRMLH